MSDSGTRFWPFKPKTSIVWSIVILVILLFILLVLKRYDLWEISRSSDTTVLIGVLLVSLLPVVLAFIDRFIELRGKMEIGSFKIDFSQVRQIGRESPLPTNIGISEKPINTSSVPDILTTLRDATDCEVVVINLKEGFSWFEIRLLVLLAGAVRLGKPDKIVFVGKKCGVGGCFLGWGYSRKLLPLLLKSNPHGPQYQISYHAALAAGQKWALVERRNLADSSVEPDPPFKKDGLAAKVDHHQIKAFDRTTGLPNTLLTEQLLALDLSENFEEGKEKIIKINIVRLKEIFQAELYEDAIDISWTNERQITRFFNSDMDYLAVTEKGKYQSLTSRLSILNAFVRSLMAKKQD